MMADPASPLPMRSPHKRGRESFFCLKGRPLQKKAPPENSWVTGRKSTGCLFSCFRSKGGLATLDREAVALKYRHIAARRTLCGILSIRKHEKRQPVLFSA